jgi:hypothetical protein
MSAAFPAPETPDTAVPIVSAARAPLAATLRTRDGRKRPPALSRCRSAVARNRLVIIRVAAQGGCRQHVPRSHWPPRRAGRISHACIAAKLRLLASMGRCRNSMSPARHPFQSHSNPILPITRNFTSFKGYSFCLAAECPARTGRGPERHTNSMEPWQKTV